MPYEWKPITIDASVTNIEGGQATVVKAGDYLLKVKDFKACTLEWLEKQAKAGKDPKPWVRGTFEIVKGPEAVGRTYSELFSFSENAFFRLGQLYARSANGDPTKLQGREFPTFKHFEAFASVLTKAMQGKEVGALVTREARDGTDRNQVAEFYVAADYDRRTQFQAPTNGTAPAPEAKAELDDILAGATEL